MIQMCEAVGIKAIITTSMLGEVQDYAGACCGVRSHSVPQTGACPWLHQRSAALHTRGRQGGPVWGSVSLGSRVTLDTPVRHC